MPVPDGQTALTLPALPTEVLEQVSSGSYYNPHAVLGQHLVEAEGVSDPITVIRTLRPLATEVSAVLSNGARTQLTHLWGGIWQGFTLTGLNDYTIEARYDDGSAWIADDPYRYSPTLGELDLHL
ncbi:MAG: 1,4-alpha-glucan branching enzyme, partial [Herbiconiux sp.]|nr:1,4-alpha-glucan branching enzyme [Herbiconiux sp.]